MVDFWKHMKERKNMPLHNLEPSPWDELSQAPREATEFERDDLFDDVASGIECSVRDGRVLVRTPLGACVIRKDVVGASPIVLFDHVSKPPVAEGRVEAWVRRTFWFNEHSVKALGDKLRKLPRKGWGELLLEVLTP